MLEEFQGAETVAAEQHLRSNVDFLVAQWRAECGGDPLPNPRELILALAEASEHEEPAPDLRASSYLLDVVGSLVERGPDLEVLVNHLVCLREVLHRHIVTNLPPAVAVYSQHQLNRAIDVLIEICTSRATDVLRQAAFVDPLTGLLNRRALERDLDRELARATRHSHGVSIVISDMDGLKKINDTLGHATGDAALRSLAEAVRSALRAGDSAYRIGGDEFVMVLPMSSAADVAGVVNRVRSASAPTFGWGHATFPDDGSNAADLLAVADQRLLARRKAARHGEV